MDPSSSNTVSATVQVAGYGKHPTWSDHIEGLGAASPVLSKIEGELYLGAIGSLITSGDWPSASSGHAMAKTVRRFLWQNAGDLVFGWMWPSADQVGRDHYPMILCVQVSGVDAGTALPLMDPLFQQAMLTIRATRVRSEVVAAVQELQVQARKALLALPPEREDTPLRRADEWVRTGPLDSTRWHRLLYFLKTQYADAAIAETGSRLTPAKRPGSSEFEGMRLPSPASAGLGGLTGWLAFLRTQLRANAPALLVQAEGTEWCDVIVGAVNATTLKPVLGGIQEVYPVTDVPFVISPEFALESEQALKAVGLPWGDSGKVSIFGPVPSRYRPNPATGRSASTASKAPAVEVSSDKATAREGSRSASAPRSIPWIPIAAGVIVIAGIAAFLALKSSGSGSSSPTGTNGTPAPPTSTEGSKTPAVAPPVKAAVAPVDSSDHSGRWLLYWDQYRQLKDVAATAEPGTLWAEQVTASLGDLDPKNWEPWFVVFGGRDKVRGAEIDNISTSKLAAQAANLRRGADAASRLMNAATNGYAASIRFLLSGRTNGPAAGLVPGWQAALTGPMGTAGAAGRVRALATIEAQLLQTSSRVTAWTAVWSQVTQVDPQQATTIRSNDLVALRQIRDPAQFASAIEASVAVTSASREWAQGALPRVDPDYLAASISKLGPTLTWNGWSNAVVGATRVIGAAEVASVKEALRAEAEGDRLKFLLRLRKDQGDPIREELAGLSTRFIEVSQAPLVQANPQAVAAFRGLQTSVTSAGERLQKAWSLVASPKAQVQLSRDTRKLATPLQEFWLNYLNLADRKVAGENTADAAGSTLRWTETLDSSWAFFSALESGSRDTSLTQAPQPLSGRVAEAAWRLDVWSALQAMALDPATLRFRMDAPAVLAAIQRDTAGVIKLANASLQLNAAWAQGRWTNTTAARGILAGQPAIPAFKTSLKTFNADRLLQLATETWSKPIPESGPAPGSDLLSVSAICERIAAEPTWAATDAHWKAACDLAGFVAKAGTWKDLGPQKAWLARLWQARVGGGLSIDSMTSVTAPLSGQPGLEGWLPAGFLTHQRWVRIAAALQAGQLNEAKRLVDVLRADTGANRLPESPANRAVIDQLAALKLPEDPFERVDWERTKGNRPFTFELKSATREAVAVFPSGIRVTFVLPPAGVAAPILVAREEFSARDLATLLNSNPELTRRWVDQTAGGSKVSRKSGSDSQVAGVWNNVGITPSLNISAEVPRIVPGSVYKGVDPRMFGADGADLPANCISAVLAEGLAAALGCRLPSPAEWNEVSARVGSVNFPARPKTAKALSEDMVARWEAKYERTELAVGRLATVDAPGDPGTTDRGSGPFFQAVNAGGESDPQALRHWLGNVAEYLRDPQSGALSVAGGSFASGLVQPQALDEKAKTQAYIDAGLRLVLDRVDLDQLGQAKALLAKIRLVVP
jgi:hypothetical protein